MPGSGNERRVSQAGQRQARRGRREAGARGADDVGPRFERGAQVARDLGPCRIQVDDAVAVDDAEARLALLQEGGESHGRVLRETG